MTKKKSAISANHLYGFSLSIIISGLVFLSFGGYAYLQNYSLTDQKEASAQGVAPENPSKPPDQNPTTGGLPIVPGLPSLPVQSSSDTSTITRNPTTTPISTVPNQVVDTTVRTGGETDFVIFLGVTLLAGIFVYYYSLTEQKSTLKTSEKKLKLKK